MGARRPRPYDVFGHEKPLPKTLHTRLNQVFLLSEPGFAGLVDYQD